jgi:hypothetical protein
MAKRSRRTHGARFKVGMALAAFDRSRTMARSTNILDLQDRRITSRDEQHAPGIPL